MNADPLDQITWLQYKTAFVTAVGALGNIAAGHGGSPALVAATALAKMTSEVRRLDDSEPSWTAVS